MSPVLNERWGEEKKRVGIWIDEVARNLYMHTIAHISFIIHSCHVCFSSFLFLFCSHDNLPISSFNHCLQSSRCVPPRERWIVGTRMIAIGHLQLRGSPMYKSVKILHLLYLWEKKGKLFPERIESFEWDQRASRIQGNTGMMPTPSNFFWWGSSRAFFLKKNPPPPFFLYILTVY